MKSILPIMLLIFFSVGSIGCQKKIEKTSLELQAFQAKNFETNKKIAFAATVSVFQDLGYIISSADLDTGFINAKSPTSSKTGWWSGKATMKDTNATAFIEQLNSKASRIRLNFVKSVETSSGYGAKTSKDTPVEDPEIYGDVFNKIREAIFIRSESE